jgi:hypothetical protein
MAPVRAGALQAPARGANGLPGIAHRILERT